MFEEYSICELEDLNSKQISKAFTAMVTVLCMNNVKARLTLGSYECLGLLVGLKKRIQGPYHYLIQNLNAKQILPFHELFERKRIFDAKDCREHCDR